MTLASMIALRYFRLYSKPRAGPGDHDRIWLGLWLRASRWEVNGQREEALFLEMKQQGVREGNHDDGERRVDIQLSFL